MNEYVYVVVIRSDMGALVEAYADLDDAEKRIKQINEVVGPGTASLQAPRLNKKSIHKREEGQ